MVSICRMCEKEFTTYLSEIARGRGKYCSRYCFMQSRGHKQSLQCQNCSRYFWRYKGNIRKGNIFCNLQCRDEYGWKVKEVNAGAFIDWHPEMAYVLGLLVTDGCMERDGSLRFGSTDQCLVEYVRDFIAPKSKVRFSHFTKRGKAYYVFSIGAKPIRESLFQLNYPSIHLSVIPSFCLPFFLRGVIDGDGGIYYRILKGFPILNIQIASGNINFLDNLGGLIKESWNIDSVCRKARTCYVLYFNHNESLNLGQIIYKDLISCPTYLPRKYENWEEAWRVCRLPGI